MRRDRRFYLMEMKREAQNLIKTFYVLNNVRSPSPSHPQFVVGSLLCFERLFSGYSGFPLSSETSISKFQFDQESGRRRTTL